jgi:predicted lipoprotein with Yx(FWY)xxD motif
MKIRYWIIALSLLVLVAVPVFAQDSGQYTVGLSKSDELGPYLVGPEGLTLYSFTPDPLNDSACYDKCADSWPPLLVAADATLTADEAVPGVLSTITRKDGTLQVAYNGIALYYWVKDEKPGDTTGNRVGNVWWIVPPATVYVEHQADLGTILAGPKGLTLYRFTKDTGGTSNCYDKCATNWPALTVASADELVSGVNLPGKLGTTARTDGSLQVTYNDVPLYYWKDDKAPGDALGQGVGQVWYTVSPETVVTSNNADLGDFLISANGMTVYTFAKDTSGVSNCTGDCLKNWPPVTVGEKDQLVAGKGISGELATITRDDSTVQVTYNGMPLYYFKNDKSPGDTTGQGVGNSWSVVKP